MANCSDLGNPEGMDSPEHFVRRPADDFASDNDDFEGLYAEQVLPGGGGWIDYRLPQPKWRFLCWLTERKALLLHGSNRLDIEEFTPRPADDIGGFGAQTAVYATSDGIWPIFFSIVNRSSRPSLVNDCIRLADAGDTFYYFSTGFHSTTDKPWVQGAVYVLRRGTLHSEAEGSWAGHRTMPTEWASPQPVRPTCRLRMTSADFPYLDRVRNHDPQVVTRRAAKDPDAFPWHA